jgi:F-type H+-transporting ATPase subunit beta
MLEKNELIALVGAAQQNDQQAFCRLVTAFQPWALSYANGILSDYHQAEDVCQDAFVTAYEQLDALRTPEAFPGWLRRIVFSRCSRVSQARPPSVDADSIQLPDASPDQAVRLVNREQRRVLAAALAALPQQDRIVIRLFYFANCSHRNIAGFLDVPISTVKKRLHDALHKLMERTLDMTTKVNQTNDAEFADKVQLLIAIQDGSAKTVGQILERYPKLISAEARWPDAAQSGFWPGRLSPLHRAAGLGRTKILGMLIDAGAPADGYEIAMSPLHTAVLMDQLDTARLLIDRNASVDVATDRGLTPLHFAAMRDNAELATVLMEGGADQGRRDKLGRRPQDWALEMNNNRVLSVLKGEDPQPTEIASRSSELDRTVVSKSSQELLGRAIDAAWQPLDGGPKINQPSVTQTQRTHGSEALYTGIKAIDLIVPLAKGGVSCLTTPNSGIGKIVTLTQIIYNLATIHDHAIVYVGAQRDDASLQELMMTWREAFGMKDKMVENHMVHVFGQQNEGQAELIETGCLVARHLADCGHNVTMVIEGGLAQTAAAADTIASTVGIDTSRAIPALSISALSIPALSISALWVGDWTAELLGLAEADCVITLDKRRASEGLFPAIDPQRSSSRVVETAAESGRKTTRDKVIRTLLRYVDIWPSYDRSGIEGLQHLANPAEEQNIAIRGRQLDRFLTQPFFGTEMYTGLPGVAVAIEAAIRGCEEILEGRHDDVPQERFQMIGAL